MLLWAGQTVSWFGDSLYLISLLWLVQELTGSRAMMGAVAVCRTAPQLLQVLTGALVDRWDRRRMMLYADLGRAGIVMSVPLLKAAGLLQPWHLPAVALLLAVVGVLFYPARQALTPAIVGKDEITQANSLMTLSQQLVFVVGYAVAGLMISVIGIMPMFTIDSLTFMVSVGAIALLKLSPEQSRPALSSQVPRGLQAVRRSSFQNDLVEGFRFILRNRAMVIVLPLAVILNFLVAPIGVLMPAWVTDVLGAGAGMFGFLQTATTAGMVVGAVAVGVLAARFRRSALLLGGLVIQGSALVAFAAVRGVPLPLAMLGVVGFVNSVMNVILISWVQSVVPKEMMGRVFGTMGTVSQVAAPAGQALAGVLGDLIALPLVFGGAGAIFALIGCVYAVVPVLRGAFDIMELQLGGQADDRPTVPQRADSAAV